VTHTWFPVGWLMRINLTPMRGEIQLKTHTRRSPEPYESRRKVKSWLSISPEAVAHRQCQKLGNTQPIEDSRFLTCPAPGQS